MKTIRTKTTNGKEIIIGLDTSNIDPMASRRERKRIFLESPEWQVFEPKMQELRKLNRDHYNAQNLRVPAKVKEKREELEPRIQELTEEIAGMEESITAARDKAHNEGTIRFPLRKGEHHVEPHEIQSIEDKLNGLKENEYLLRTGEIVHHVEGLKYWKKDNGQWKSRTPKFAEKIPAAWAPETELKPAEIQEIELQMDLARIMALSPSAKTEEFTFKKNELLTEAAHLRSKMEITGDSDALEKSQAFYQEELAILENKYQ
jgi:hypothetical protein